MRVIAWPTHSFGSGVKIDSVDSLLGSYTFASIASYGLSGSNGLSPNGHWWNPKGARTVVSGCLLVAGKTSRVKVASWCQGYRMPEGSNVSPGPLAPAQYLQTLLHTMQYVQRVTFLGAMAS